MRKEIFKNRFGVAVLAMLLLVTAAFVVPEEVVTDNCGVFALGEQKVDLSKGETSMQIVSRQDLVSNIKSGITYSGTQACPGQYKFLNMDLEISTDQEDVSYKYNFEMIRDMQSMEDYMLVRYFNDARTLTFRNIVVENENRGRQMLPDVTYRLQ